MPVNDFSSPSFRLPGPARIGANDAVKRFLPVLALAAACSSDGDATAIKAAMLAPRFLVLGAFPTEVDSLLRHATIAETVVAGGRSFFVGQLGGEDVVIGMSGIGLVNAEETTRTALETFEGITGIVFSGVSGTRFRIGDVMIPARWTEDLGETWVPTDETMLEVAAAAAGDAVLDTCAPLGDPACLGLDTGLDLVCLAHEPEVIVGGDGRSSDPFGGRELPCVPLGGDVFGCDACLAPNRPVPDPAGFLTDTLEFLDPALLQDFAEWSAVATSGFDVDDMETAAVARVAHEVGVPFLGIRAASDGQGDPLGLPGFPVQFFAYRVIAADNAATVTRAFLEAWPPPSLP